MWRGSLVALVTPMLEDGEIDLPRLQALIDWHIAEGSDAIVAVGTTGESATLSEPEHCDLLHQVVAHAAGRIPIIAGTGANSTREAIDLTRCAAEAGVDACLLVTPYYNKPTQQGLYLHHRAVAEAVNLPQILYNVPGRTACDLRPETVARLAGLPNIVGIKEATGQLERLAAMRELCPPDFLYYSGDDATAREFVLAGGHGAISVTANVAPRAMHEMLAAALSGDAGRAAELDAGLADLHRDLFLEANPIPVKWALAEMGRIGPTLRLPMTPLSPDCHAAVRAALRRAGALPAAEGD